MRLFLFILLFTISNISSGQPKPASSDPSPFDKFIKNSSIEWAAYNIDSIRFQEKNLNEILRKRYSKAEIKVTQPIIFIQQLAIKPVFYPKDELDQQIFHPHDIPMFDSLGNKIPIDSNEQNRIPENLFDSISYNAVEVFQLFYLEFLLNKKFENVR